MDPYIGQIMLFAGNFAPVGWALCNGQLMSISQNSALFAILGTTYGGDGVTTFGLPDLRGRVPLHFGQGPGLGNYTLGEKAGVEAVTLTTQQMPIHGHAFTPGCSTDPPNAQTPENSVPAQLDTQVYGSEANAAMRPGNSTNAGGSQPHDNLQPYLCVTFIIALQGIFPSRS
jgi:microcystin-dependent protein